MAVSLAGKNAVLVVAPKNFRDEELFETRDALERAGVAVKVASSASGNVKGLLGGAAKPDLALADASANDFDAVVFIGGSGSSVYFSDKAALGLAKSAFASGRVVGAICIAPSILANAGILKGKRATAYQSEKTNLEAKGAEWSGEAVVTDGRVITANGPAAAKRFGEAIAAALAK